jgi:hypothetical protein
MARKLVDRRLPRLLHGYIIRFGSKADVNSRHG